MKEEELEKEPASEDLEQEIDRYWCSLFTNINLKRNPDTQSRDIFIPEPQYNERGARFAYALCIDWKDESDCEGITLTPDLIRSFARHFAQWQKEQMMKGAIEGEVETLYRHIVYVESVGFDSGSIRENKQGVFAGDKVKVIIIKE